MNGKIDGIRLCPHSEELMFEIKCACLKAANRANKSVCCIKKISLKMRRSRSARSDLCIFSNKTKNQTTLYISLRALSEKVQNWGWLKMVSASFRKPVKKTESDSMF